MYNIEDSDNLEKEFKEDTENILLIFEVLEDDYLGGHGTRGYGRIKFIDLELEEKTYTEEGKEKLEEIKEEIEQFSEKLRK